MDKHEKHPLWRDYVAHKSAMHLNDLLEDEDELCWSAFLAGAKAEANARNVDDEHKMMEGV